MVSESALKTVSAFNALPSTPEKEEISRQYMADEISSYEFFSLAQRYLDNIAIQAPGSEEMEVVKGFE